VVAIMALRLDRLQHRRLLHLHDRPHRRSLPHLVPRRRAIKLRYLGRTLARLQPRRHGLRLVRRAGLDRWPVCAPHDLRHGTKLQEHEERHSRLGNHERLFLVVFHLLVD